MSSNVWYVLITLFAIVALEQGIILHRSYRDWARQRAEPRNGEGRPPGGGIRDWLAEPAHSHRIVVFGRVAAIALGLGWCSYNAFTHPDNPLSRLLFFILAGLFVVVPPILEWLGILGKVAGWIQDHSGRESKKG